MRRRLIPMNVVIAALLFILLSLDLDKMKIPAPVMQSGKKVYERACSGCHQPGGEGISGLYPSLIDNETILGSQNRLIKKIVFNVTKPEEIHAGKLHSPAYPLGNQEIADVLTYVRNCFGNKAGPVTAREVKKVKGENR